MVGLVEASEGLGTTLGPVMGSTLYILTNYAGTFYVYGIINLVFALAVTIFFPRNLQVVYDNEYVGVTEEKEKDDDPVSEELASNGDYAGEVTYCGLMSRGRYFMAMTSSSVSYFAYCMLEPILAERLLEFKMSQANISLFFVIASVFYIFACILASWIPKRVDKRVILILASVSCSLSYLFVGPSVMFGFPDSLGVMVIGHVLLGLALPFQFVPVLPEMTNYAQQFYQKADQEKVKNYSSALFTAFTGIG